MVIHQTRWPAFQEESLAHVRSTIVYNWLTSIFKPITIFLSQLEKSLDTKARGGRDFDYGITLRGFGYYPAD